MGPDGNTFSSVSITHLFTTPIHDYFEINVFIHIRRLGTGPFQEFVEIPVYTHHHNPLSITALNTSRTDNFCKFNVHPCCFFTIYPVFLKSVSLWSVDRLWRRPIYSLTVVQNTLQGRFQERWIVIEIIELGSLSPTG